MLAACLLDKHISKHYWYVTAKALLPFGEDVLADDTSGLVRLQDGLGALQTCTFTPPIAKHRQG